MPWRRGRQAADARRPRAGDRRSSSGPTAGRASSSLDDRRAAADDAVVPADHALQGVPRELDRSAAIVARHARDAGDGGRASAWEPTVRPSDARGTGDRQLGRRRRRRPGCTMLVPGAPPVLACCRSAAIAGCPWCCSRGYPHRCSGSCPRCTCPGARSGSARGPTGRGRAEGRRVRAATEATVRRGVRRSWSRPWRRAAGGEPYRRAEGRVSCGRDRPQWARLSNDAFNVALFSYLAAMVGSFAFWRSGATAAHSGPSRGDRRSSGLVANVVCRS